MKESFDLFPTLVTTFTDVLSSSELDDVFKKLKKYKSSEEDYSLIHGRSSYLLGKDILSKLGLTNLMQEKIDEYVNDLKYKPLTLVNSWFSIQDMGGMLKEHDHVGSVVSGVFYINVDGNSNPLVFENPNAVGNFINRKYADKPSSYTYNLYRFFPKKGDLILFPSWLRHGCEYNPNRTKDRTTISFNTECQKLH